MDTSATFSALADDGWKQRPFPGYMELVGPLWSRREEAGWAYGLLATPRHLNPAGIVHGGLITSLLDQALSINAWEAMGRRACVTIQLDTQFMAAAREGQFLVVRSRAVRTTNTLAFMQGALSVSDEEIATASALLKLI